MAEDGEILRQVWNSYLPVAFRLAPSEVTSLQEPDPYYLMVSRISYFPLVMDKVVKHMTRFVTQSTSSRATHDMWLDFDSIPLKWHYPIGLLWDLLGSDSTLPWTLTVHFQDFPEDELLFRCNSRSAIESHFMSCLKEADALKHRSVVMANLQKKDHNQLWLGLHNDKFDQFWAINRKLMQNNANEDSFRFIPFRVHHSDGKQTQRLIRPVRTNAASGATQRATLADLCEAVMPARVHEYRWITHGIEPAMDTPLDWLSAHMSYADNFLHICALKRS